MTSAVEMRNSNTTKRVTITGYTADGHIQALTLENLATGWVVDYRFTWQNGDMTGYTKHPVTPAGEDESHTIRYDNYPNIRTGMPLAEAVFLPESIASKASVHNWYFGNQEYTYSNSRKGKRIGQPPREVVLQAGDTLLLECPPNVKMHMDRLAAQLHFFDSANVPNIGPKTLVSSLIMIAMAVVSALGIMTLLQGALIAAAAMLIFRCCTPDQAMKAINLDIIIILAASVVLGMAIQKTGIAEWLATGILDVCSTNPIMVMTATCLVAACITEFISNTAAGAMFFPIMYEATEKLGYEPYPFLIALMISVSSSFDTPIGSPTHMLVYAPGGYRFSDFMRIGVPMKFIILAATIFIVNLVYPLTPLH